MSRETATGSGKDRTDRPTQEYFEKARRDIERYSIIALFGLIGAILFLSINLRLVAGGLVIAAAALGVLIFRKTALLYGRMKAALNNFSSQSEKKDNVIIDFSHKIREPLNNLVFISDLLKESGLQKKQKDLLETFIASTNNMVTILNELTMKSAGHLGYQERKAIKFNLLSTIQNTIELFNLKDKVNIDFIINRKEFSDLECYGDPIILKQIFLDLFSTMENQVSDNLARVTINLMKDKEKEKEKVAKNFIGLRIQTDKRVVLIDESGNISSLSAGLISSSGGRYIQETGNNSTVLHIFLPYIIPPQGLKEKTAAERTEEHPGKLKIQKELKDLLILLVEDNPINQKITLLTLTPLVHTIETASNGQEAIDKFISGNYDLILMDIMMPVMNGLLAAENIRSLESATDSHIPIIAITANAMIGDKEKCLSAGCDDYISKPYQPAALINKIKSFL